MLTKVLLKTSFSLSLIAALCVCAVHAQSPDSLVLNVTVANEKGGLSRGLNLENFSISVDKQPQKILSLSDNEVPASIGILIDDSGSQYVAPPDGQSLRDQLKPALERFLKASDPANEYFVMMFNNKVRLTQDWTSDTQAVLATLDSLTFKKYTSVWDAMTLALEKVKTGRNAKHILLVISDGDDNSSKSGFKKVRDQLKASDVALYSVGVNLREYVPGSQNYWNPEEGINRLHELSTASGGRTFFTKNQTKPATLNEVFESIALELRSQYQLVIAAGHQDPEAKWRKVKIEAKHGAERLTARTRLWYYR